MRPLDIRTKRLTISPMRAEEAVCYAEIVNQPDVARMLVRFSLPFTQAMAIERIAEMQYTGELGFGAGIRLDGVLIGSLAFGGDPVDTAYFFEEEHCGKGYATEAMTGFLAWVFNGFELDEVHAGAFEDNVASQNVLTKLGFTLVGQAQQLSKARLEPALCFQYRLTREAFANRKTIS